MAATESSMVPLGTTAPSFKLEDTATGQLLSLDSLEKSKGLLIMFICNHCPFVKHVLPELVRIGCDFKSRGLKCLAISSNDALKYPEDSPAKMKQLSEQLCLPFPYLHDESQEVAIAYGATCTPDFFLFDEERRLVYRGQLDDSRPGSSITVSGSDLREAIECLLSGMDISKKQKPSLGCNIKWKT